MHRLVVSLLAALDAALAAVVGVAAALAPLALLWLVGGTLPWDALWPTAASVWQLGHLVPLHIHLPQEYLAVAGIDKGAATFVVSLAPLAFAAFTGIFAARSGVRAARTDAAATGPIAGTIVFAGLALLVAITARNPVAAIHLWQGVLFPAAVYAIGATIGALVAGWQLADPAGHRILDRARAHVDGWQHGWSSVLDLTVRGAAISLTGLIGLGAVAVVVALIARGGNVIALFEAGHIDLVGAIVVTLAQLAYLPTVIVWGMSFVAGPGFEFGAGTTVSPAGTQLGVVPGIPLLGALPQTASPYLLVIVLLPIGLGAFAGWAARTRLSTVDAETSEHPAGYGLRAVIALGIALLTAGGAALLCLAASGSLGPGSLAVTGPQPGPVALAVGLEVLLGAAIMLLSPMRSEHAHAHEHAESAGDGDAAPAAARPPAYVVPATPAPPERLPALPGAVIAVPEAMPDAETVPIEPLPESALLPPDVDLGPDRPQPLPPPPGV